MNNEQAAQIKAQLDEASMFDALDYVMKLEKQFADASKNADELLSMKRMFESACADLGLINEALGLDPDDGGAEPILDAIEELKRAALSQPKQEPDWWLFDMAGEEELRFARKPYVIDEIGLYYSHLDEWKPLYTAPPDQFQGRVEPWLTSCFGPVIAADKQERNHRFFEESTEAVQANGMTRSEAHQLVDYTYDRPVGELNQEVGGVMVTLAALCLASGINMHAAGEVELARIWTKVGQIRSKQAAKPKHSPLPAAPAISSDALIYPAAITPELTAVLSLMNFQTGPLAHVYRAAGHTIAHKCEAEQAFMLDRMIKIVLEHGENWRNAFSKDVSIARDAAMQPAPATKESV